MNNSFADPNNPCIPISKCNFKLCVPQCEDPLKEYRTCGPLYKCDPQACRGGARPRPEDECTEEDAAVCVAGCYCKPGYKNDFGRCAKVCPLYP